MKLGILKSWNSPKSGPLHKHYIESCKDLNIEYEVIDILNPDWVKLIEDSGCDAFLCRPPDKIQEQKNIYDEKIYFLNKFMKKPIYPSFNELYIYENKRNMANFLQINKLPHPKTYIFGRKDDSLNFLENSKYPLVFKTNIGNASQGVIIVKNLKQAKKIVNSVFGRFHEFFALGKLFWTKHKNIPVPMLWSIQKNYLLIQDYCDIKWEWRIIKIGNTFAGHQKLLNGEFASGSDMVGWIDPPKELLEMVRLLSIKHNFHSLAVDIFETSDGDYLINEIQSLFGSYLLYQMKIDNKRGVYHYESGEYIFVEGEFHQNASNDLRVKHCIELLGNNAL